MRNFLEATINSQVQKAMLGRSFNWSERCTEICIQSMIEGFAVYLGRNKNKDNTVAAILVDMNDRFHFGMYVQYQKQDESGGDEGSWSLSMTFDERDIDKENWTIVKFPDDQVLENTVYDLSYTRYGGVFKFKPKDNVGRISEGSPQELFCTVIDALVAYMRANVAIDPQLDIPNYCVLTGKLEGDGSVYIGAEPSALIKQHVKDDFKAELNDNRPVVQYAE